jgi:OPA family sugar phosphate sensor protein UhpC-like MFS transporter
MSTTLTPAHRTWRMRVFAATWLSYVGFYFCRKPFSAAKSAIGKEAGFDATTLGDIWAAYLIAYAIGQFLAAGMGTRLGPRKNVLLGTALSIGVTLAMGHTLSAPLLAGLVAVNGLAQATGWSGNVGTMASWFHRHERGRVMGLWATNFTVGSLVSAWVMAWVLSRHDEGAPPPWRACFTTGALVLSVVWCVFFFFQRNRPEDVGLAPVLDPQAHAATATTTGTATTTQDTTTTHDKPAEPEGFLGLTRAAWTNLLLVAVFYFFVKLIRYAVWSWAAFFLERNYGLTGTDANTYSTAFDLMGIPGVWVTGWLSDRVFGSRRADVALAMMLVMTAACGALMLFGGVSVLVFGVLLGVVGFSLFGPDALLTGAGAMDIGSRRAATFAAAIISGFGSLGPIVQELVIGRLYDNSHGDLTAVFGLLLVSAVCALGTMVVAVVRNRRGHPPL